MKIADLVKKKNQRVRIRVPVHLQDKLGTEATGRVTGLTKRGNITWVNVKVNRRKTPFKFRPQDLTAA